MLMNQPNSFFNNIKFTCFLLGISFLSLGIYDIYTLSRMEYDTAVELANIPELLFALIGGSAFFITGIVMQLKQNKNTDK